MKYKKPEPYHGQSFLETIAYTAIGLFIYFILAGFFKALFWPFHYLFMTNDQVYEEEKKQARQKIADREGVLNEYRDSARYPVGNPEYVEWFRLWQEGKIIDSRLLWAPDVYLKDESKTRTFNPEFLNYFELQIGLHKKAGWSNRVLFKRTLQKYYPEFSQDIEAISSEISNLRNRIKVKSLSKKIASELQELGLSESIVKMLLDETKSPKKLLERATTIKTCLDRGFCDGAAVVIDELGINPASKDALGINLLITKSELPAYVSIAFIKNQLDKKAYDFLTEWYNDRMERSQGDYEDATAMLMMYNQQLEESAPRIEKAKLQQVYGKAVWETK